MDQAVANFRLVHSKIYGQSDDLNGNTSLEASIKWVCFELNGYLWNVTGTLQIKLVHFGLNRILSN
jgi:hypothetical protein